MPGQGFAQLLIIVFVAILFIIGLLVFNRYKKLSFVLFGISIFFIVSTFYCKSELVKTGEKIRIGDFKLDYAKSHFGKLSLTDFANITLKVRSNNTFEIIGNIPLQIKKGDWEYIDDGDISFIEYKYNGETNVSQMQSTGVDSWIFSSNGFAKPEMEYALVFIRK